MGKKGARPGCPSGTRVELPPVEDFMRKLWETDRKRREVLFKHLEKQLKKENK
jgi:hypothetical protein